MNLKERARKLKKNLPAVYLSVKDKRTPAAAKILAFVTVVYALSPVDLIPDFIPVLGYLDDIILLPAMIALTVKLIPEEVWSEKSAEADGMWENGKPKKWYYAIPVILIWILLAAVIVKIFR